MPLGLASFWHTLSAWDEALFFLINRSQQNPLFDILMPFVTNKWNFIAPAAFLFLYLLFKEGKRGALLIFSTIVLVFLADGSATVLKGLFQRVRPCHVLEHVRTLVGCTSSFSTNRGTNIFALATLFAAYYRRVAIPAFTAAALVGYSQVYVGVHYPFDVLGGALLGVLLGLALAAISLKFYQRGVKSCSGSPTRAGS